MDYKVINAISANRVPCWGNQKKYIAVHYLGVDGQGHDLASDGCGAHFYIYWDGTIYQRCSLDAVPWAVGTAGYFTQKHPDARNGNTISIEMCCHNSVGSNSAEDKHWWFTTATQEACVWLVQKLMKENDIPIGNVLRHYDIVNKVCPNPYVYNNKYKESWTWDEFKAKVTAAKRTRNDNFTYTVKKGDTLSAIAKDLGCTVNYLKKWNKLTSDQITTGQVLKLYYRKLAVVTKKAYIRKGAGSTRKLMKIIRQGTQMYLYGTRRITKPNGKEQKWYKVWYNDKVCYVLAKRMKKM